MQPVEADGPQSTTLLHLVAAREVSDQIRRAYAAVNGTTPPVIDGEPASQAQQQQHRSDEGPPDLYAPALE